MPIEPKTKTIIVKFPYYVANNDQSALVALNEYEGSIRWFAKVDVEGEDGYVQVAKVLCEDIEYDPPNPMTAKVPNHVDTESLEMFAILLPSSISDATALEMVDTLEP